MSIYDGLYKLYKYRDGGSLAVWAAAGSREEGGLEPKAKWALDRNWQGTRKAPTKEFEGRAGSSARLCIETA